MVVQVHALCPVSDNVLDTIKQALANDRSAEYLLGLTLDIGDDLPRDLKAGVAWIARAAELGDPDAARNIASRLRNGQSVDVDETKIADALKPHLAQLYLNGAPGVPSDRPASMKCLAASAEHGNVEAMLNLGYMSLAERDLTTGFCWLMRAALLDRAQAQEKLSSVFADGVKDDHGTVIEPDLVQADLWFRLAARSPYHDNSQIRAGIEPHNDHGTARSGETTVRSLASTDDAGAEDTDDPAAVGSPRDCPPTT